MSPADDTRPTASHSPTDSLARVARGGDEASCDLLFRRIAPAIYAWARLNVRPPLRVRIDPDDVMQEVACRALASFASWDPRRAPFRAFVFGIAKNVLRKALERLAREPAASGVASSSEQLERDVLDSATALTRALARDESLLRLMDNVERLPDDERRLLLYRGLEGMSHDEVARLLAVSPDAVAKRWQRLCDRLRAEPRFLELVA